MAVENYVSINVDVNAQNSEGKPLSQKITMHDKFIWDEDSYFACSDGSDNLLQVGFDATQPYFTLSGLDKFLSEDGQSLSADSTLASILTKGVDLGKHSLQVSQNGKDLNIDIDASGYHISVTPRQITLTYSSGEEKKSYSYSSEGCVDVSFNAIVVINMLLSERATTVKSAEDIYDIPPYLLGMYFKNRKDDFTNKIDKTKLTKITFTEDGQPYCFVTHVNKKNERETLLFTGGKLVPLQDIMEPQYDPSTNSYNLVATSKSAEHPEHFAIPIEVDEEGFISDKTLTGLSALSDGSTLYDDVTAPDGSPIEFFSEVDGKIKLNKDAFVEKGAIDYTPNFFAIMPVEAGSDEAEGDASSTSGSEEATGTGSGEPAEAGSGEPAGAGTSAGAGASASSGAGAEAGSGEPTGAESGESAETSGSASAGEPASADGGEPAGAGAGAGGGAGGGASSGAGDRSGEASGKPHANNPYLDYYNYQNSAEAKQELKERNAQFKANMQTFNTAMGDSLFGVGAIMTLVSLIPGVGLAVMIPGLILSCVGLVQTTFADDLVFSPFKVAKHKIRDYRFEEGEEFEYRSKFLEREKELDRLHENSQEALSEFLSIYSNLGEGENTFALTLAELFNSNGVGIAIDGDKISQLHSLDHLDQSIAMASILEQIASEGSEEEKAKLIESFADNYFQDLTEEQLNLINTTLFSDSNKEGLKDYVRQLNQTNTVLAQERTLFNSQQQEIDNATIYRIKFFASTAQLSEEQRVKLFERYGEDIIKFALTKYNGSAQILESIVSSAPEGTQAQLNEILDNAFDRVQAKFNSIDEQASDNVAKHEQVETLRGFAGAISQLENVGDNLVTIDQLSQAVKEFTNGCTQLLHQDSKAMESLGAIADALVRGKSHLDASHRNEQTILNQIASYFAGFEDTSAEATSLTEKQKECFEKLEEAGFYKEIATLYQHQSARTLLPALSGKVEREESIINIVDTLAKERLLSVIEEASKSSGARTLLAKKTPQELAQMIEVADDGKVTVNFGGVSFEYTNEDKQECTSTLDYVNARAEYDKEKNKTAISLIDDNFVKLALTDVNNSSSPIARFDSASGSYIVENYNDSEHPTVTPEAELFADLERRYPSFATYDEATKRRFVLTKLGLEGQQARLKHMTEKLNLISEREELRLESEIKKGVNVEANKTKKAELNARRTAKEQEYEVLSAIYGNAEELTNAILSGKVDRLYDDLTIRKTLEDEVDLDATTLSDLGAEVSRKVVQYTAFEKLITDLPISEQEKKDITQAIKTNLSTHSTTPLDQIVREELKPYLESATVDGRTCQAILTPFFEDDKLDGKKTEEFCQSKDELIDKRTKLNLTSAKFLFGDKYTKKQYKTSKNRAKATEQTYTDYVDFFAKNSKFDSRTKKTPLYPDKTFESEEELKEQIISDLAKAKTKRAQDKVISGFTKAMGCEKEYKSAKKLIADKNVQNADNRTYIKATATKSKRQKAHEKVETLIQDLLVSDLTTADKIEEEKLRQKVFDHQQAFDAMGVSAKTLIETLKNDKLTQEQKEEKIKEWQEQYNLNRELDDMQLDDIIAVADEARFGATEEDRAKIRAKAIYKRQKVAYAIYSKKSKLIEKFLTENPTYPYAQELINAFAKGDQSFFDLHPEAKQEGLSFDINDLHYMQYLGIDSSSFTGKTVGKNLPLSDKERKKFEKTLKKTAQKLTEKLQEERAMATVRMEQNYKAFSNQTKDVNTTYGRDKTRNRDARDENIVPLSIALQRLKLARQKTTVQEHTPSAPSAEATRVTASAREDEGRESE